MEMYFCFLIILLISAAHKIQKPKSTKKKKITKFNKNIAKMPRLTNLQKHLYITVQDCLPTCGRMCVLVKKKNCFPWPRKTTVHKILFGQRIQFVGYLENCKYSLPRYLVVQRFNTCLQHTLIHTPENNNNKLYVQHFFSRYFLVSRVFYFVCCCQRAQQQHPTNIREPSKHKC